MKMRFIRAFAFAGQCGPASGTKSPPPTGRRIELRDLTISNDVRVAFECHKDGNGRTAMLPTTFAMAPRYRFSQCGSQVARARAERGGSCLVGVAPVRNVAPSGLPIHRRGPVHRPTGAGCRGGDGSDVQAAAQPG